MRSADCRSLRGGRCISGWRRVPHVGSQNLKNLTILLRHAIRHRCRRGSPSTASWRCCVPRCCPRCALWNELLDASNGQRAEEQHVPKSNVQHRRLLADDGLDDQQPQSRRPCFADAAMCSAVIMLTCLKLTALDIRHQSMLTSCSPCPLNVILGRCSDELVYGNARA